MIDCLGSITNNRFGMLLLPRFYNRPNNLEQHCSLIDVSELHKFCRSTDFEALELRNFRSGREGSNSGGQKPFLFFRNKVAGGLKS